MAERKRVDTRPMTSGHQCGPCRAPQDGLITAVGLVGNVAMGHAVWVGQTEEGSGI